MAFRAHPYRHPTIGWLPDLRSMTRDDLFDHYRRYYIPNNATLVVAGDVETSDVLRRVERTLGGIPSALDPPRLSVTEPPQIGERRVVVERPGTTAYLKLAWPAPAATEPDFFPMLVLDAILTGAKGLNLWSSFRGSPPQRKARLYTRLVDQSLASNVSGALVPTAQPFLYTLALTATGTSITADVTSSVAIDTAGNGNTAATQWAITYDATIRTPCSAMRLSQAFSSSLCFSSPAAGS